MLPTDPRFFVLPLIAVAVIMSLPAPKHEAASAMTRAAAPAIQHTMIDCQQRLGLPTCALAANLTQVVTR